MLIEIKIVRTTEENSRELKKLYKVTSLKKTPGLKYNRFYSSESSFTKKRALGRYIELYIYASEKDYEKGKKAIESNKDYQKIQLLTEVQFNSVFSPRKDFEPKDPSIIEKAGSIEFGIRSIKRESKFLKRRNKMMGYIKKNDGYLFDIESNALDKKSSAVIFGWDSMDHFNAAGKKTLRSPKIMMALLKYFTLLKQIDFQVGVPIK